MIEASTQQDKDFGRHASMQEKGIVPVGDCGIGTTYGQQMDDGPRKVRFTTSDHLEKTKKTSY